MIGPADGPVKVGVTNDVESRRSVLQVASLTALEISLSVALSRQEAFAVERHAHFLLKEHRVRGEWFRVLPVRAVQAVQAARRAVACGEGHRSRMARAQVPKAKLEDTTIVRFAAGTLDRIDAVAGKNRRAKWIRELVEGELRRQERRTSKEAATPRKPTDP
ncbi:GIY-YIG nuclease family protein [Methylorubrum suomiense]|uniref:GIY-YIG nuclease family protein n=1 Tax=Methylorubrum suomiense TaxID=144191 RepID=UPI003570CE60